MNADELLEALAQRVADLVAERTAQRDEAPQGWLTVKSAAAYLDTTEDAIRALASAKKANGIPAHRRRGRVLFSPAEIDAWVREGDA